MQESATKESKRGGAPIENEETGIWNV